MHNVYSNIKLIYKNILNIFIIVYLRTVSLNDLIKA